MESDNNNIFKDGMKCCEQMMAFCSPCLMKCLQEASKAPGTIQSYQDPVPESRVVRKDKPSAEDSQACRNLLETCQKMMEGINQLVESAKTSQKSQDLSPHPSVKSEAIQDKGSPTENQMMCCCMEVCQHSPDCLKRKEKYDKPKESQSTDYSGKSSKRIQEQFDESMKLAEKLTNQCEDLLQRLQKEMSATANLLEQLGEQLTDMSKSDKKEDLDDDFKMTTILASAKTGKRSSDTSVSMKLFDSSPTTRTGPGDTSWDESKYSKPQVQSTAKCCRKRTVLAGCQSLERGWKH
uniref:Clusterin-like isoform X2 n=1 Tax=Geotrypetes seraphini TaxID=260995 RepID=A0A6P8R248_GEOSA|nr:clusterin-like isoform X2 [Geotrypetes seraphini]